MLRPAVVSDKAALLRLAQATGLFKAEELGDFEATLDQFFTAQLGNDHFWTVDDDEGINGASYYAPQPFSAQVWNLYFIGVHPNLQGKGRGSLLLRDAEDKLRARGERLLLIETSGLGTFELTRRFYRKHGYDEEARIRDFYGPGDDKVIFRKDLQAQPI